MTRRIAAASTVLGAVVALSAGACGGDDEASPGTTEATQPATTQPATEPEPQVRTIRIIVRQGRPRGGIARPVLEKGDRVRIVVRTDAGIEVHLHGYEITRPVRPGQPTQLAFRADLAGRFELELHHPDAVLADLEVRP